MPRKVPSIWKLNNTLLNNPWIKKEIAIKIESILNLMMVNTQHIENV